MRDAAQVGWDSVTKDQQGSETSASDTGRESGGDGPARVPRVSHPSRVGSSQVWESGLT